MTGPGPVFGMILKYAWSCHSPKDRKKLDTLLRSTVRFGDIS